MGFAKPCTYLHPAHFNRHPVLYNAINVMSTKISHVFEQFPQVSAEKFKAARFD